MHTIARNACKFEYAFFITSKILCISINIHQCGRIISSRLKYSRNALYINVLPFARYFRQCFAPFIRHRRRSQGYPYKFVTFTKFVLTYNLYGYLRASDERPYNVAIILLYSENSYKRKRSALRTPFSYAHKIIKKEGNSCLIK